MRKKYQSYSLVNLTLNMRYKMTKKYQICQTSDLFFFQAQNAPKSVFGRQAALDRIPLGSLRRSPRPPSRLGGGYPLPISLPARRLQRLELGAPSTQNPGYASGQRQWTENKSFAKVRNLDHTPVAKDTGYSV